MLGSILWDPPAMGRRKGRGAAAHLFVKTKSQAGAQVRAGILKFGILASSVMNQSELNRGEFRNRDNQ
jgi:hypothetical protein